MLIPLDAEIPRQKLTRYLLVPRSWDDKSKFLARAGFTLDNPDELEAAIREGISRENAIADGSNDYGTFYRVDASITGPNGRTLDVVLIWLEWKLDGTFHFVTLKPLRRMP